MGDSVQGRFCGDWIEWPGMPGALLFQALAVVGGLAAALLLHMSRGRTHVGCDGACLAGTIGIAYDGVLGRAECTHHLLGGQAGALLSMGGATAQATQR